MRFIIALSAGFAAIAANAEAGVRVSRVAEVMRNVGYGGQALIKDDEIVILSEIEDIPFEVQFYNCEREDVGFDAECDEVLFVAFPEPDEEPSLDVLNAWNATSLVGRAYKLSDGVVGLDHPIAADGGLDETTIADNLDWFDTALMEFVAFLESATGA
ncbi:MAG: YbjN domain-containing protein [Pseudomonadota bacterium]